jgi:hypothetical protein
VERVGPSAGLDASEKRKILEPIKANNHKNSVAFGQQVNYIE